MTTVYDDLVFPIALEFGVPPEWILATIGTETSFVVPAPNTFAPSVNEYAYGPMQVLLSTARGLGFVGTPEQLADPEFNIAVGTALLSTIRAAVGDDFRAASSEYFSGNPERYKTDPEVRTHVERAMRWLKDFGGAPSEAVDLAETLIFAVAGFLGVDLLRRWAHL